MRQVFRSRAAQVLGWIWMAFAAFNAVDLVVRYNGPSSMVAAAVLAVLTALVFVTCLRPAVVLAEDGVLVRNPLRNTFVPWRLVDEVTVSHSITITSGGRSVRCWTPQTSGRERMAAMRRSSPPRAGGRFRTEPVRSKAEQAAAEAMAGKTHADWVAEQITERAESAKRVTPGIAGTLPDPGTVKVAWAPTTLAALAVAAVAVVAAFLV
ncbi:PH domain-containing protein [Streptosporangium sp. NPDC051023]|uniref:PH domain-containing protein n=1 Tax=Streptosporangium sp. NPDC051023 TaxID=3155410 RepID=UPI00344E523C